MSLRSCRLSAASLAACVLLGAFLPAQEPAADAIRTTVTAASGDLGGKMFGVVPDPAKTRHYYVAAEPASWDYVPAGRDEVCGLPLPPPVLENRRADKLRYVQYTDETFTTRAIANPSLGILGPVLRGVVGEYLAVTFLNRTPQPLSMHPHGVRYDKDSEGAFYQPAPGRGAAVGPGARYTYIWQLDESSGPLPGEPSSKGWLYHSHVTGDAETNLGLVGCIIVTDPARARPDGTPVDVDREFATLFMIFDESGLDEATLEAAEYGTGPAPSWAEVQQLAEQGSRVAINGHIFGSLPGLKANEGERTRWYLFGLGSQDDFHTAHWHGQRVIEEGRRRTDVIDLLPATMKVADLRADTPGDWLFHCHVAEHMSEGMFARFTVFSRETVGIGREPETAFLGLPHAGRSLRIDHVETALNPATHAPAEIVVRGAVTAYDGLAIFNETMRVQFGGRTLEFHPDRTGVARAGKATLRVTNANDAGVVRGPLLAFEIAFAGSEWVGGSSATVAGGAASPRDMPLTMEFNRAKHVAVVHLSNHASGQ